MCILMSFKIIFRDYILANTVVIQVACCKKKLNTKVNSAVKMNRRKHNMLLRYNIFIMVVLVLQTNKVKLLNFL